MNKRLRRLIASLLFPCLVVDPLLADALTTSLACPTPRHVQTQGLFKQQALAEYAIPFMRGAYKRVMFSRWTQLFHRLLTDEAGTWGSHSPEIQLPDYDQFVAKTSETRLLQSFSGVRTSLGSDADSDQIDPQGLLAFSIYSYVYGMERLRTFSTRKSGPLKILIARDPRGSQQAVLTATIQGLLAAEQAVDHRFELVDLGVVTTPIAEYAVRALKADGAVMISASHNPLKYNGHKYMTGADEPNGEVGRGALLSARKMSELIEHFAKIRGDKEIFIDTYHALSRVSTRASQTVPLTDNQRLDLFSGYVQDLHNLFPGVDLASALRDRQIAVDPNGGAGSAAVLNHTGGLIHWVLKQFGLRVSEINGTLGKPAHGLEPREGSEGLQQMEAFVTARDIPVGMVFDFDADRGVIAGLEPQEVAAFNVAMMLSLMDAYHLADDQGVVVVASDATSRRIEAIAHLFSRPNRFVRVRRVETGEIHVVAAMQEERQRGHYVPIGVEGPNGGTILGLATCRDGVATALLTSLALADSSMLRVWSQVSNAPTGSLDHEPTLQNILRSLPERRTVLGNITGLDNSHIPKLKGILESHFKYLWDHQPLLRKMYAGYRIQHYEGLHESSRVQGQGLGGWCLTLLRLKGPHDLIWIRPSRTEPMVRYLIDTRNVSSLQILQNLFDLLFTSAHQEIVTGKPESESGLSQTELYARTIHFSKKDDLEAANWLESRMRKRRRLLNDVDVTWRRAIDPDAPQPAWLKKLTGQLLSQRERWYRDNDIPYSPDTLRREIYDRSPQFILEQVIANAFDAYVAENNEGSVDFRITQRGHHYIFEVSDNGIGISDVARDSEGGLDFSSYAPRVGARLNRREGGKGIAIAWSNILMHLHGGLLEAWTPGLHGYKTTVRFTVPAQEISIDLKQPVEETRPEIRLVKPVQEPVPMYGRYADLIGRWIKEISISLGGRDRHWARQTLHEPQLQITESHESMSRQAVEHVIRQLFEKPDSILLCPTGNTPTLFYSLLAEAAKAGRVSFQRTKIFMLDEYDGGEDYRHYIDGVINSLPKDNRPLEVHVLNGKAKSWRRETRDYERKIREAGGIDLAVLGVGPKTGHLGFNESGSSFESRTRRIALAPTTQAANSKLMEQSYTHALTVGIRTILDAREIIVLASGEAKAEPVGHLFSGPPTERYPITSLLLHDHVTLYLDQKAAARRHAAPVYELLNVLQLDNERAIAALQIETWKEAADVTVRRIRIPEIPSTEAHPMGLSILPHELGMLDVETLQDFDLLYNARGRLIAVFPVVTLTLRNLHHQRRERSRMDLRFFDLSPYYLHIPQFRDPGARQDWAHYFEAWTSDQIAIFNYQKNQKVVGMLNSAQQIDPYTLLEINPVNKTIDVAGIDPRKSNPYPWSWFSGDPLDIRLFPVFPTVYSPAESTTHQIAERILLNSDVPYYQQIYFEGGFSLKPGMIVRLKGPGAGIDSYLTSRRIHGSVDVDDINPIALANTQASARIHSFKVNVAPERDRRYDRLLWNMPYLSVDHPGHVAPGSWQHRFGRHWDNDYGGTHLGQLAHDLPLLLNEDGQALLWNYHYLSQPTDVLKMTFERQGFQVIPNYLHRYRRTGFDHIPAVYIISSNASSTRKGAESDVMSQEHALFEQAYIQRYAELESRYEFPGVKEFRSTEVGVFSPTPIQAVIQLLRAVGVNPASRVVDAGGGDGRVALIAQGIFYALATSIEFNHALHALAEDMRGRLVKEMPDLKQVRLIKGLIQEHDFRDADIVYYTYNEPPGPDPEEAQPLTDSSNLMQVQHQLADQLRPGAIVILTFAHDVKLTFTDPRFQRIYPRFPDPLNVHDRDLLHYQIFRRVTPELPKHGENDLASPHEWLSAILTRPAVWAGLSMGVVAQVWNFSESTGLSLALFTTLAVYIQDFYPHHRAVRRELLQAA